MKNITRQTGIRHKAKRYPLITWYCLIILILAIIGYIVEHGITLVSILYILILTIFISIILSK